jgi:SHS2 domain-containing protein
MGFRLRDHTADVAVEATADDLEGLFAAVADGLTAAACDDVPEPGPDAAAFELSVAAESREALLFDYLDQLIYERDVRNVLPVRNRVTIEPPGGVDGSHGDDAASAGSAWRLDATARGVPLAAVDAREIKAVTYSEMRVDRTEDGWTAYVVFDV